MSILVTGSKGFAGSNFVFDCLAQSDEPVMDLFEVTYAGDLQNQASLEGTSQPIFIKDDIADNALVIGLLEKYRPRAMINFAAESHIDQSILSPEGFLQANVLRSFRLLEASRSYYKSLTSQALNELRFFTCFNQRRVWQSPSKRYGVKRNEPLRAYLLA